MAKILAFYSNFASDYGACVLQICMQCELSATFYYSTKGVSTKGVSIYYFTKRVSSMHKQGYV